MAQSTAHLGPFSSKMFSINNNSDTIPFLLHFCIRGTCSVLKDAFSSTGIALFPCGRHGESITLTMTAAGVPRLSRLHPQEAAGADLVAPNLRPRPRHKCVHDHLRTRPLHDCRLSILDSHLSSLLPQLQAQPFSLHLMCWLSVLTA